MISVNVNSFPEWRNSARTLVMLEISPEEIHWQTAQQDSLFGSALAEIERKNTPLAGSDASFSVPQHFLAKAQQAACFIDSNNPSQKWAVLYSLLWRIRKIDRRVLSIKSDAEVQALQKMASAVSRDKHKMKAFVRFQKVIDQAWPNSKGSAKPIADDFEFTVSAKQSADEYYTSWFEPEHAIVDDIAPFFVKRFTGMNWSILTPHGCAHWDQKLLKISAGVSKPDIDHDQFDDFWRAYYRSIFNPARLKEQAMRSEMPKKYWKYLPEASCIKDLSRGAATAMDAMVVAPTTDSERIRKKARSVATAQDHLRAKNQR